MSLNYQGILCCVVSPQYIFSHQVKLVEYKVECMVMRPPHWLLYATLRSPVSPSGEPNALDLD